MILIILLLLFSLYMFWRFDQQRKIRNAEHHREKREAFTELLTTLKQEPTDDKNKKDDNI